MTEERTRKQKKESKRKVSTQRCDAERQNDCESAREGDDEHD